VTDAPRPLRDVRRPVWRAMSLLEVLADAAEPLGLSELARRAAVPKSTVARLLADLVDAKMVVRRSGGYQPGPRALSLAMLINAPASAARRRVLLPYLVRLRDETGLDTSFATLRHGQVHFENIVYGSDLAPVLQPIPLWGPAHCTCSGKVLLAFADRPSASPGIDDNLRRYTGATITDPAQLTVELLRVRQRGFAMSDGEYVAGLGGLAVPVLGSLLTGALAVCSSRSDLDHRRIRSALRRTARDIRSVLSSAA
jgi:DNA-binding IclR family transcriptional regulator